MRSRVMRVSVIDEVVAQLEEAIVAGEYSPNSKLPPESQLAAEFAVSRPIVREALARLRERGYVRTVNGRGTYVRESDLDAVSEALLRQVRVHVGTEVRVDDLYEVRRTIEVGSVTLAAERATVADIEALQVHVDTMVGTMASDPEGYSVADVEFHLGIAQASQNPLYPLMLAPVVDLIVKAIFESVRSSPERMQSGIDDHNEILDCIRRGDGPAAVAEVEAHLRRSRAMHTASVVTISPAESESWPRAIRMH